MKGADGSTSGPIPKFVNARGILRYERRNLRTIKADSDQFDALAVPPGLMVRSRDVRPTQIPQSSCAASRTMGPPHPSRRALRDDCRFSEAHVLAPSSG